MSRERFEASLTFVLKWEGAAFTNDPDDHGGATKFGVIQREYDAFRRRRGLPLQSVRFISMDEAREIYRREYWDAVEGDIIPAPLDVVTFDTAVLMGVGRAVRFLQQSLGVGVDGAIGPMTRAALATADADAASADVMNQREARLRSIVERDPTQRKFMRGWLNRLNDLRRLVARGGVLASAAAAEGEEELKPYDDDEAAGRALADLPDDFPEQPAAARETAPALYFFETKGAAAFARAAAGLSGLVQHPRYVIDARASDEDVLVVASGTSARDFFELPSSAVESVTPLGLHSGDPGLVVAAVVFKREFRSLAAALGRNGADAGGGGASNGGGVYAPAAESAAADFDPGSPSPSDLRDDSALEPGTARALANYGGVEPDTNQPAATVELSDLEVAPADAARVSAARTLPLDPVAARAFLNACTGSSPRVRYGLGAKVPFHGARPGSQFTRVDCSGFVREAIWRATSPHLNFPDGSVVQHDWVRAQGFARGAVSDGLLRDGATRIAFLRPQDSPNRIGHVVLIHNAVTFESHGGVGPNSRAWTGGGWQARASVYMLRPATN